MFFNKKRNIIMFKRINLSIYKLLITYKNLINKEYKINKDYKLNIK